MPPKGKSEGGLPDWWDPTWAPRSVEFKIQVDAVFHSTVGTASIITAWIDATGHSLSAPTVLGPLSSFETDDSATGAACKRWPGAVAARMEKSLGSLTVSADLVRGLQQAVLPLHLQLGADPTEKAGGYARVYLGPLLLSSHNVNTACHARPAEVAATGTETLALAGLHRLEVKVTTDIPLLSSDMLARIMPFCCTVGAVRGLPNELWLQEACQDVHLHVYPEGCTSNTTHVAEECQRARSSSKPHNTFAKFDEPFIWLLGGLPRHAIREWLQSEEIVVEVHDRDVLAPEVQLNDDMDEDARLAAERKQNFQEHVVHPHGVARFKLAPLLTAKSLALNLQSNVFPCRGNKKALHDQAGYAPPLAERLEYAPDYLTSGCVCTIRAALGAPLPMAQHLQALDEGKDHGEWCAVEKRDGDSNIYVVASPTKSDKQDKKDKKGKHDTTPEKEESGSPAVVSAPKSRCRAKIMAHGEEVSGPWRVSKEDAEEDERHMLSVMKKVVIWKQYSRLLYH
jgi:hypothetical protein